MRDYFQSHTNNSSKNTLYGNYQGNNLQYSNFPTSYYLKVGKIKPTILKELDLGRQITLKFFVFQGPKTPTPRAELSF